MIPVAVKMLLHNKVRAFSTLLGVAVAFFLSSAQIGLMIGWCNTISAIIRHAEVDVWVMAEQAPAFEYGTSIPRQRLYQVRSVPGVDWAESMFTGWMLWQRPDGGKVNILLVGVDDGLAGGPWEMNQNEVGVVFEPNAVIVDSLYADALGVHEIGDEVEMNNRKAIVRGFSRNVRTFTAAPFVFTSLKSAVEYSPWYRSDEITFVLARCKPGITPQQLRDAISAEVPSVQVLTTDEFIRQTILYWMLETGIGITVIITALLGMVVGTVIISQTLYAITNDQLPHYATLLAIGFGRWQLAGIVLIQATLMAVLGAVVGSLIFGRVSQIAESSPIPLETTPLVFGSIVIALVGSCWGASALAIRSIFRLDPVTVFHN